MLGLIVHPRSSDYQEALDEMGLCGPRALLFSRFTDRYRDDLPRLIEDSKRMGRDLQLVDGVMKHEDVENLVRLPLWSMTRIVSF